MNSDEQTYFRPACVLGNDKSGMQKENDGCQIKKILNRMHFSCQNTAFLIHSKCTRAKAVDVLTALSGLWDSWHHVPLRLIGE